MKRSVGVTISAILTLLGSLLMLLMATLMVLAVVVTPPSGLQQAQLVRPMMYLACGMFVALAGWGIATGIGLLRLQRWSRISIIIFSVLLLIGTLPAIPVVLLMPIPPPPNAPQDIVTYLKIFMAAFYGLLAAVGIWWLVLFTRKPVRDQFQRMVALGEGVDRRTSITPRRPVSITVIAWFMIAGAPMVLVTLLMRFPAIVLGHVFTGWSAISAYVTMAAIQAAIGVGLLKLNPTARAAAIAWVIFGLFNAVVSWTLPGRDARFTEMMSSMPSVFAVAEQDMRAQMVMGMVMGVVSSVVFTVLVLWFLTRHRQAFMKAALPDGTQ